jgi:hypothetical protein
MATALEFVSLAATTLDSPPEDFRSTIGLAKHLLNTLQAVYPPVEGPISAARSGQPHKMYATAAMEAATTNTSPTGQSLPGPQQKKPKPKLNTPSSQRNDNPPTTQLILHFCDLIPKDPHPFHIHETINKILPSHTRVAGVNYTCAHNIVLHALPCLPSTVTSSQRHSG